MKALRISITGLLGVILLTMAWAACSGPGEDRPGSVAVDPESESVSVSGVGPESGTVSTTVTGTGGGPGEVKPRPSGAEQVDVSLGEWTVATNVNTVKAGQVYFLANNLGPVDPHELVIIRTDLAPDQLPVVDGRVPEDQVDIVGEIEPFNPGTQAADSFSLGPGNYVLICNIAEVEEGALESHYELGMRARLVVE